MEAAPSRRETEEASGVPKGASERRHLIRLARLPFHQTVVLCVALRARCNTTSAALLLLVTGRCFFLFSSSTAVARAFHLAIRLYTAATTKHRRAKKQERPPARHPHWASVPAEEAEGTICDRPAAPDC